MSQALELSLVTQEDLKTNFNFTNPSFLKSMMEFAKLISESDLAPKDFKGRAGNTLIAIQMGLEVGLAPMQAIQNISVINGRPCVWGDAMLAIVQNSGKLEYIKEWAEGNTAYCETKRKGYPSAHTTAFSDEDAKKANLLNKLGPWQTNPTRMKQMRARAFNLRDQFADILRGLNSSEEVQDYQPIEDKQKLIQKHQQPIEHQIIAQEPSEETEFINDDQRREIGSLLKETGLSAETVKTHLFEVYKINQSSQIKKDDFPKIIEWMKEKRKEVVLETAENDGVSHE